MCDYDYDDGGLQQSREIVARKPHRCYACDETIAARDRYVRTAQIHDHEVSTYHHCLRCWAMCEMLWRETKEAIAWDLNCGEIWEEPPPEVAALAFLTKAEIQALKVSPRR